MDFGNPWALVSGLFIGLLGMALFIYGKKQADLKCLLTGGVLCIFPYFVTSVILMWLITGACVGGLFLWAKADA